MVAFYTNVAVLAVILAISAMALNMLIGESGIFSAAQGVIYGLGAYATALVAIHITHSLLVGAIAGLLMGATAGLFLAIPAVRVRGEYFVIASVAFTEVLDTVLSQWTSVTGGNDGISGVPVATLGPLKIVTADQFLVVGVVLLAIVAAALYVLMRRGPLGRVLHAVAEDDAALASIGKNPRTVRIVALMVSGAVSGVAGTLYAFYVTFVDPSGFGLTESVLFVTMVILGGAGSLWAAVLGAIVVEVGSASLGLLSLPSSVVGPLPQVIIGAILILLMVTRPDGLRGIMLSIKKGIRPRDPTATDEELMRELGEVDTTAGRGL